MLSFTSYYSFKCIFSPSMYGLVRGVLVRNFTTHSRLKFSCNNSLKAINSSNLFSVKADFFNPIPNVSFCSQNSDEFEDFVTPIDKPAEMHTSKIFKETSDDFLTYELNIDTIVRFLRHLKLKDICVVKTPDQFNYAEYIIICSGYSSRQLSAAGESIDKLYKNNLVSKFKKVKIEGLNESKDWVAIDTGSFVIHLMTESAREKYDLETLWACGSEFDDKIRFGDEEESMDDWLSGQGIDFSVVEAEKVDSEVDSKSEKGIKFN